MKRILVPTDFSKAAETAIVFANKLAGRLGADVVLLHCTQETKVTPALLEANKTKLRTLAERLRYQQPVRQEARRIRYKFESAQGCLQNQVLRLTQANSIDLVVMALEYTDCEPNEYPGSHASSLMRVIGCPVLLVPENTQVRTLGKLVFATDFTDQNAAVQQQIVAFAASFQAQLAMVQVYGKEGRSQLYALKLGKSAVEKSLNYHGLSCHLLEEENMLEGISDFAENQQADMLVLATRDSYLTRNLFDKRYTKTSAYHTRIPVLTFYQEKAKPCAGCCTECSETKTPAEQTIAALG